MLQKVDFFEKGQSYHIVSRTVEGRKIFENEDDCYRFVFQAQAANFGVPALNTRRLDLQTAIKELLRGKKLPPGYINKKHDPFVHIIDFCLVVNHYHFYLIPNITNGIIPFINRLNLGFAKYYNLKYKRKGTLFSGRYKRRHIDNQVYSDAVKRYISIINPLDVFQPGWREKGLKNKEGALSFLKNYEFSSFLDNIGQRQAGILAPEAILSKYKIGEKEDYQNFAVNFIQNRSSGPYQSSYLE